MAPVNILVEGLTDEPVAKKLLLHLGLQAGPVYGKKGKSDLLKRLANYNKAAQFSPWFVIIDLDKDTQCPSEAMRLWLPQPAESMICRIAVRTIEAWLLADRKNLAHYLSVSEARLQQHADSYADPKEALVNIARHSSNSSIRSDMVPRQNSGARVGPLYVARLNAFTEQFWNPDAAAENSSSLGRCIRALKRLKEL